jgi:ABC-type uncharacterized transport system involved in gliding motility auxiliary subunit
LKEILKKIDLLGLTIIMGAAVVYSVQSTWSVYQTVAVVVGAVVVVVSLVAKFDEIRNRLARRSSRFGMNSVASVLLLLGVLGILNYLGAQNPHRVDLTTAKIYSLSEQSVNVSGEVTGGVHIRAFYPGGDDVPTRDLLELFTAQTSEITFEFIDPDRQPQLAERFDVSVYGDFDNPMTGQTFRFGTLVLDLGDKRERVEKQSEPLREEDVTNALMKLVKGEQKTIYFIEGHGEKLIAETERNGLDTARLALERENYVVSSLNLVSAQTVVPEDASVLVWPGPATDPFPEEIAAVQDYLEHGGSVFVLLDPTPAASLIGLLEQWSVSPGDNFVVDASGVGRLLGAGPEIPLVSQYGPHVITDGFGVMTFFPLARSISTTDPVEGGLSVTELLTTGERSWGETDLDGTEAGFDPEVDLAGPVGIGLIVTRDLDAQEKSRLAVFGDSDFATNGFFNLQGNGNLFLNTVSWLAEDESFISIRPRVPEDRRLTLTQSQGRITYYISLVLLPLSILTLGISVWMKRRAG